MFSQSTILQNQPVKIYIEKLHPGVQNKVYNETISTGKQKIINIPNNSDY